MSDLAAFLAARLDELAEADWHVFDCSGMPWEDGQCCDAQRWLARDVAAKRELLAMHGGCGSGTGLCDDGGHASDGSCGTLDVMLAVYSDRPDYDAAWLA